MFVASDLIRCLESAVSPRGGSSSLREGMKVEARYKGKTRYYPGVIKRENRDGTFDIDYDDVRNQTLVKDLYTDSCSSS